MVLSFSPPCHSVGTMRLTIKKVQWVHWQVLPSLVRPRHWCVLSLMVNIGSKLENRFQIATRGHVFPRNTETLEEAASLGTEKAAGGWGWGWGWRAGEPVTLPDVMSKPG